MNPVDTFYAFKFLRLLTQDWKDMEIYHLGIIDDTGKRILDRNKMNSDQRGAYNAFARLVVNLKRILEVTPATRNVVARYAAALALLRDHVEQGDNIISEMYMNEEIENTAGSDNIKGYDQPLGAPKAKFAGCDVFEVDPETYKRCMQGKVPYVRWAKYMDVEESLGQDVRSYAFKNPKKGIILQNSMTKSYIYLKR